MSASSPLVPPISWAQRPEYVLVTIALQDTSSVKLAIQDDGKALHFACDAPNDKHYECRLRLYGAISSEESQHVVRPRQIELKLKKKFRTSAEEAADDELEWPRLTEEKTKQPNITIDWSKWKDADEEEAGADDLGDFGLGGGGGGGDAMDGQYSEMLSQLMQAQAQQGGGDDDGDSADDAQAKAFAAAEREVNKVMAEDEDDDMPPLEEDVN